MAVNGKTGRVRTPRELILRTGYRRQGDNNPYPRDTNVFVVTERDGWGKHPEILGAYHAELIEDALTKDVKAPAMSPGRTWSLGDEVRCMLPWEYDAVAQVGGREQEIAFELKNRLWQGSGLQCSGTGGETADGELLPGEAMSRNHAVAAAIAKHTGQTAVQVGHFERVACWGPQCPFWKTNEQDQRAVCHTELRLWFLLLHPTTDPTDPHYLERLAWVQLSSASEHGMWDIESGFRVLRAEASRTANVPWYLKRIGRTVTPEGKRTRKWTLMVTHDREALIVGHSDPRLAVLPAPVLDRLRERALQEVALNEVLDILPRKGLDPVTAGLRAAPALPAPAVLVADIPSAEMTNDRDEAVRDAAHEREAVEIDGEPDPAPGPTEAELNARLSPEAREELKAALGLKPGDKDSLERIRKLLAEAYEVAGDGHFDGAGGATFGGMQLKHALWMRQRHEELLRLRSEAADANADPDDAQAASADPPRGGV